MNKNLITNYKIVAYYSIITVFLNFILIQATYAGDLHQDAALGIEGTVGIAGAGTSGLSIILNRANNESIETIRAYLGEQNTLFNEADSRFNNLAQNSIAAKANNLDYKIRQLEEGLIYANKKSSGGDIEATKKLLNELKTERAHPMYDIAIAYRNSAQDKESAKMWDIRKNIRYANDELLRLKKIKVSAFATKYLGAFVALGMLGKIIYDHSGLEIKKPEYFDKDYAKDHGQDLSHDDEFAKTPQ